MERRASQRSMWSMSNTQSEEAIFTIVVDKDQQLFKTGENINGFVFIDFKDTGEELSLEALKILFKESVCLPRLHYSRKKNVVSNIIAEQVLISGEKVNMFKEKLNNSEPVKIPFSFVLPNIASSFNAEDITICYELKAELIQLKLCGELCDLTATLPIELVENAVNKSQSSRIDEYIDDSLLSLQGNLEKCIFCTGENLPIDFFFEYKGCKELEMHFEIQQLWSFQGDQEVSKKVVIESFDGTFKPEETTGVLRSKYTFLLDNTVFTSQPTVVHSKYVEVRYQVSISASLRGRHIEILIPIIVERNEGMYKRYPMFYSEQNLPLLPLTVTVQELKSDGLQSYIPMKRCYENNRLTVKKGNICGTNAVLTIILESFSTYTRKDTIKGFVYLSFPKIYDQVEFDKLLIVLVGVCQYKNTGTLHKNGEMFLFRSKVLHGSVNNNECPVVLSKPSGGIVAEFDFDLSLEKGSFPPSFNSNDVFISYELKADVFNLRLGETKASLYTRLPVVIRDSSLNYHQPTTPLKSFHKKNLLVSLSLDRASYEHTDEITVNLNIENKSKKQITVRVSLLQQTEHRETGKVMQTTTVCKPIILLILPKSKLVSDEIFSLRDTVFHQQPTLLNFGGVNLSYSVTVDFPKSGYEEHVSLAVPIARKFGYKVEELSCEGYPLLPLTLEYFSKQMSCILPDYLSGYSDRSLIKVLSSKSCLDRWRGWKIK